jgi:predicted TIM-barrel fold metal-dependent hydrolase
VLLDDGFLPDQVLPLEWHERFVRVHRLLRLEWLAEELLERADTFEAFLDQFRAALDPPPANVVGLKSIAAYRTGLDIQRPSLELASRAWREWKQAPGGGNRPRLAKKHLLHFLLRQAMELAARHRLPVQFHTGFGDPDLDLRLANPLHLRRLLEDGRFRTVPVVLLHAAYPFSREAGYLASVYPQVYIDMGLSVPFLSVSGMRTAVRMLLELAPFSKLMYSSDAHLIPELYYLGAKWGRQVLGACLDEAIADGDLTSNEAEELAVAVLQGNARRLYHLGMT